MHLELSNHMPYSIVAETHKLGTKKRTTMLTREVIQRLLKSTTIEIIPFNFNRDKDTSFFCMSCLTSEMVIMEHKELLKRPQKELDSRKSLYSAIYGRIAFSLSFVTLLIMMVS
jgi:hypothetical protein